MKTIKYIYITLVVLLAFSNELQAQQDAQYTQYMFNTLSVNPAYAGSREALSILALYRSQWVGLNGAPTTQTVNFHSPVSARVGLGLSIVNDEIGNGTSQDTYFDGVFSYSIPASDEGTLSFGLKAGGHFLNVDFNQLENFQARGTALAPTNIDKKFSPNFGMGIYYYTQSFYAGFSIPNFLETEHFDRSGDAGGNSFLAQERMNFYFMTGYVMEMGTEWKFKPAVLLKAVRGAPLQADFSANFLLRDKLSFGVAYRWSAAISALVGMQLSRKLMLGLAYDRETTRLGNTAFNDGSFELFLRYELQNNFEDMKNPRFF